MRAKPPTNGKAFPGWHKPTFPRPTTRSSPSPLYFGNDLLRYFEINHREQKLSPQDETLRGLLMRREVDDDTRFIRVEDKVKHGWDFLGLRLGMGRLEHVGGNRDESWEQRRDQGRHRVWLLVKTTKK